MPTPVNHPMLFVNETEFEIIRRACPLVGATLEDVQNWVANGGYYNRPDLQLVVRSTSSVCSELFPGGGLNIGLNPGLPLGRDAQNPMHFNFYTARGAVMHWWARHGGSQVPSNWPSALHGLMREPGIVFYHTGNERGLQFVFHHSQTGGNEFLVNTGLGPRIGNPRRAFMNERWRPPYYGDVRRPNYLVRTIVILGITIIIVSSIIDYLDSLPDSDTYCVWDMFDCTEGPFGPAPRVVGDYLDFRVFDDWLHDPPSNDPHVNTRCQEAMQISLGVAVTANLSATPGATNPSERWYVYPPDPAILTGDGPWTMSVTAQSAGVLQRIRVRNGYCYTDTQTSNLNAPVVDTQTKGCHEFQVSTREPIFVVVSTEAEGLSSQTVMLEYGPCVTDPGDSCLNSTPATVGQTYGPFTNSATTHWFQVNYTGFAYKITLIVTANTASGSGAFLTTQVGNCLVSTGDISDSIVGTGTLCKSSPGAEGAGDTLQFAVSVDAGSLTYSIRFEYGAC